MNAIEKLMRLNVSDPTSIPETWSAKDLLEIATELRRLQASRDALTKALDDRMQDAKRAADREATLELDVERLTEERDTAKREGHEEQERAEKALERMNAAEDAVRGARGLVEAYLLHNPEGSFHDAIRALGNAYRAKRDVADVLSKSLAAQRVTTEELRGNNAFLGERLAAVTTERDAAHKIQAEQAETIVELGAQAATDRRAYVEARDTGLRLQADANRFGNEAADLRKELKARPPAGYSVMTAWEAIGALERQRDEEKAAREDAQRIVKEVVESRAAIQGLHLEAEAKLHEIRKILDAFMPNHGEREIVAGVRLLGNRYRDSKELAQGLAAEALDNAQGGRASLLAHVSDVKKERDAARAMCEAKMEALRTIRRIVDKLVGPHASHVRSLLDAETSTTEAQALEWVSRLPAQVQEANQQRTLLARRVDEADAARDRIAGELRAAAAERDELQAKLEALTAAAEDVKTLNVQQRARIQELEANPWSNPKTDILAEIAKFRAQVQRDSSGPTFEARLWKLDPNPEASKALRKFLEVSAGPMNFAGEWLELVRYQIRWLLQEVGSSQAFATRCASREHEADLRQKRAELQRDSAEKAAQVIAGEHGVAIEKLQAAEERIRLLVGERGRPRLSEANMVAEIAQRRREVEELREEVRNWKSEAEGKTKQLEQYRELFDVVRRMRKGRA